MRNQTGQLNISARYVSICQRPCQLGISQVDTLEIAALKISPRELGIT